MTRMDKLKADIVFSAHLRGHQMTFHTTWGCFSPRRIDDGSYLLLQQFTPFGPGDATLDLGCGYGALGLTIAKLTPDGEVHLVDRDFVAIGFAEKNARLNGLDNCRVYLSNAFDRVPNMLFDNVVSNLPANVGKEMLSIILHDAHSRLKPGGKLYLVTVAGLRQFIKRNLLEIFGNYDKLKQAKHYAVASAVKPQSDRPPPDRASTATEPEP